MQLMWLLPSLSVIGAVTTLSAAASAAAALILFFRALFPAFSSRLVAAAAITMRRGLLELCEGAISCPVFFGVIPFALNSHLCTGSACLISLPSASALSTCIMTVSAMQPSSWGLRFVHDVACTLAPLLPLVYKRQHVNLQSIIRLLWFEYFAAFY